MNTLDKPVQEGLLIPLLLNIFELLPIGVELTPSEIYKTLLPEVTLVTSLQKLKSGLEYLKMCGDLVVNDDDQWSVTLRGVETFGGVKKILEDLRTGKTSLQGQMA